MGGYFQSSYLRLARSVDLFADYPWSGDKTGSCLSRRGGTDRVRHVYPNSPDTRIGCESRHVAGYPLAVVSY